MPVSALHNNPYRGIRRLKTWIFVVLIAAGLAAVAGLEGWGRTWALTLYRPVLLRKVSEQIGKDRFGQAEATLLAAVRTSPEYAPTALDAATDYLDVLPELGDVLENALRREYEDGPPGQDAALNLARVRFARGRYQAVLDMSRPTGCSSLVEAQWDYLVSASRRRLGLTTGIEVPGACSVLNLGTDALPLELRLELEPYVALWKSVQAPASFDARYLKAAASLEVGDFEHAGDASILATSREPQRADALFRAGQILEAQGLLDDARARYGEALSASDQHRDAAAAFLRLTSPLP